MLAGAQSLAAVGEWVADARDPRGVRHSLTSVLLAAVAAVLAGAQSLAAVGEWVADAPPQVLAALGMQPLPGCHPRASRARPQRAMTETGITPPCPDPGLMA